MENPELEDFRRRWQEEVSSRSKAGGIKVRDTKGTSVALSKVPAGNVSPESNPLARVPGHNKDKSSKGSEHALRNDEGYDPNDLDDTRHLSRTTIILPSLHTRPNPHAPPQSALEHYEQAEERESQGRLGESVNLYRKAFRLDAGVERAYRNKHHPPPASSITKPTITDTNPHDALSIATTTTTTTNTAEATQESRTGDITSVPQTTSQLIASFAEEAINPAGSLIDHSPPTTCPITKLPSELLIHILSDLAVLDVGSFSRMSLVCKRLAFLVATEDRIWRRVCDGSEYGFAAMHYKWARSISGSPLPTSVEEYDDRIAFEQGKYRQQGKEVMADELDLSSLSLSSVPRPLILPSPTSNIPNYRQLFRSWPRIRFNGCYISTVNYQRPGATSSSQISWNTPIHIVTYYRYLRFFRDGTCISLLTTHEPVEVIHHLSKENLPGGNTAHDMSSRHHHHSHNIQAHTDNSSNNPGAAPATTTTMAPPTAKAIMSSALPGRWHLSPSPPSPSSPNHADLPTTTVHIETFGHDPAKYTYVMALTLTSANTGAKSSITPAPSAPAAAATTTKAKAARSTKLAWKGFWSYNKLTDDWAEFGLKNDKAFWWSRVKGYGLGMDAGV